LVNGTGQKAGQPLAQHGESDRFGADLREDRDVVSSQSPSFEVRRSNVWRLSRRAPLVVVLLVVVVVAGCGSAPPSASVATSASASTRSLPPTPEPPGPSGWLSVAPDGVAFLTWTRTDNALSGSLTWVHTTPAAPHVPVVVTAAITGTINGQSVTLSLAPALTTSGTWTGYLDGERLTLSYTADDGSIATVALLPGTVNDYNSALGAFRADEQAAWLADQAAAASQAAADQAAAASQAAHVAATECSIRVVNFNAMIVVHGDNARDECAWFAAHVPQDPAHTFGWDPSDAWGPIHQPIEVVDEVAKFGSVICSGSVNSFAVAVWDTGGAHYGTIACQSLGLAP
jgi:hypothetical protein